MRGETGFPVHRKNRACPGLAGQGGMEPAIFLGERDLDLPFPVPSMMVTKLAKSHLYCPDLWRLFSPLPHLLGSSSRGPASPSLAIEPLPSPPPPTLPVAQLEAALAPTDGSCGSLRSRAQSPADIFLPVRLVGEEGQGQRGA